METGLLVIIGAVILFIAFKFLKGSGNSSNNNTYFDPTINNTNLDNGVYDNNYPVEGAIAGDDSDNDLDSDSDIGSDNDSDCGSDCDSGGGSDD